MIPRFEQNAYSHVGRVSLRSKLKNHVGPSCLTKNSSIWLVFGPSFYAFLFLFLSAPSPYLGRMHAHALDVLQTKAKEPWWTIVFYQELVDLLSLSIHLRLCPSDPPLHRPETMFKMDARMLHVIRNKTQEPCRTTMSCQFDKPFVSFS